MELVIALVVGVVLVALASVLVKHWDRKNRTRYPDRLPGKLFEMKRKRREM